MLPDGYAARPLTLDDAAALAEAYVRNLEHLAPTEPRRDESYYTAAGQEAVIADLLGAQTAGRSAAWLLVHDAAGGEQVVGRVNLNNVVRGALQSGSVGYWVDADHQGRGLATAAVEHTCAEAAAQGLHRVEAGTLLDNLGSQRVLAKCGFEPYGLAPSYLFIDGAWRDHRLFQRLLHDHAPS